MRTNDIGAMKQWWENRRYQKEELVEKVEKTEKKNKAAKTINKKEKTSDTAEALVDPLAGK
jgi:hypothetical protein